MKKDGFLKRSFNAVLEVPGKLYKTEQRLEEKIRESKGVKKYAFRAAAATTTAALFVSIPVAVVSSRIADVAESRKNKHKKPNP